VEIQIATIADATSTYQLYDEARAELRVKHIFQWPDHYPSEEIVREDIERRELYLLWLDDEIAGAICLNNRQDEQYATVDWALDGAKVLVVHRLVVAPGLQGKGLAQALMTFAERLAEKEAYSSIRLDAFTGHERVRRFYETRGYQIAGQVFFPHRDMPFWCFERPV